MAGWTADLLARRMAVLRAVQLADKKGSMKAEWSAENWVEQTV